MTQGLTSLGQMYKWFFGGAVGLIVTMAVGFHWSTQAKLDSIIAVQNQQAIDIARNQGNIGGIDDNQEVILGYMKSIGETLNDITTQIAVLQSNQNRLMENSE